MATTTAVAQLTTSDLARSLCGERNERGIPAITFVEDMDEFMDTVVASAGIEQVIGTLQEMYSKYKFMELHLQKNKANLKNKMPAIQQSIDMVEFLVAKAEAGETVNAHFNLADGLYAKAEIAGVDAVSIWLGANTMVQYPFAEAQALLASNMETAVTKLRDVNEDLEFLRNCIITSEVNMARVYNADVRRRRAAKAAEEAAA